MLETLKIQESLLVAVLSWPYKISTGVLDEVENEDTLYTTKINVIMKSQKNYRLFKEKAKALDFDQSLERKSSKFSACLHLACCTSNRGSSDKFINKSLERGAGRERRPPLV